MQLLAFLLDAASKRLKLLAQMRAFLLELRVHLRDVRLAVAICVEGHQKDPRGLVDLDEVGLDLVPVGSVLDVLRHLAVDVLREAADSVEKLLVVAIERLQLVGKLKRILEYKVTIKGRKPGRNYRT